MYLEQLAPSWRSFHRRLLSQTRVLIVDDDLNVLDLMRRILEREGFRAICADSLEQGWSVYQTAGIDLAVIDAQLPDGTGLELIERIRDSKDPCPTILVTAFASAETVDAALALGAVDYLPKPFESTKHLVSRLRAVIDRRITTLLFDVIVNDLSKAVHAGSMESRTYAELSQTLLDFKLGLGRRLQCLLIDDDPQRAASRRKDLAAARVATDYVTSRDEAVRIVSESAPLVAVVSLESPGALELIEELQGIDPQLEVLACATSVEVPTALAAVNAGAADFALLGREGQKTFGLRADRLLRRTRRHRVFLQLIQILYRAAREVNPDIAEDLFFATPGSERPLITDDAPH